MNNTIGSSNYLCPFCQRQCVVGFDCECGGKAINSAMWLDNQRPLMREAFVTESAVLLSAISKALGRGIKEMVHSK